MIYTVVDIEATTKSPTPYTKILSFGYLQFNEKFKIVDKGTLYFYKEEFDKDIDGTDAQKVHKLTSKFLSQYKDEFNDNVAKMYRLLYNSVFIGKNSERYDLPVIVSFLNRYAPYLIPLEVQLHYDVQKIVSPLYKKHVGNNRAIGTLEDYCNMYGISDSDIKSISNEQGFHSALYDVAATYLVFKTYVERNEVKL